MTFEYVRVRVNIGKKKPSNFRRKTRAEEALWYMMAVWGVRREGLRTDGRTAGNMSRQGWAKAKCTSGWWRMIVRGASEMEFLETRLSSSKLWFLQLARPPPFVIVRAHALRIAVLPAISTERSKNSGYSGLARVVGLRTSPPSEFSKKPTAPVFWLPLFSNRFLFFRSVRVLHLYSTDLQTILLKIWTSSIILSLRCFDSL